jgi:hypothetical protein
MDTVHSLLGPWLGCESQIQQEATGKIDMTMIFVPDAFGVVEMLIMKISFTVVDAVVVYESVSVVE